MEWLIGNNRKEVIKVKSFKVNKWTNFKITLFAVFLSILVFYPINIILDISLKYYFIQYPTRYILLNMYIYISVFTIPVSLIHELIHGAFYKLFHGQVRFGFRYIYAYTMETSSLKLGRDEFLTVLLAPITLISLLTLLILPFNFFLGSMIFLINYIGSSGDIYMALSLITLKKDCKIVDRKYGYDIILEKELEGE